MSTDPRNTTPKLYGPLATWFHLLTAPADYADEAALYRQVLTEACDDPPETLLELGSGGGNNASHLKEHFRMALVDISPQMLDVSRALNPDCEHLEGDMRTVRLGRVFDAVFVHDAIDSITTEGDLRAVMETAFVLPDPEAPRCSFRTSSGRRFARTRITEATTARAEPFATWSGAGTPTPTTPRTSSTSPTCCGREMRFASNTTAT